MVEYAYAISSGVTPSFRPPSTMAGLVDRGVRIPIFRAIRATFLGPTWRPTDANTELSDCAVALAREVLPEYELPKLCTVNICSLPCGWKMNVFVAEVQIEQGLIRCVSAVARMDG